MPSCRGPPDVFGSSTLRASPAHLGRAASSGLAFLAGRGQACEDPDLSAAIPLKSAGRVAGVLAVWRLLGHKLLLTDLDRRLFAVLEGHAARPLSLAAPHGCAPAAG